MTSRQVSVAEAKQHLSDLLGRVAYGKEHVTITKRGKPMAILVPPDQAQRKPHPADVQGWLSESDPFFKIMEQIVESRLRHRPRVLRS